MPKALRAAALLLALGSACKTAEPTDAAVTAKAQAALQPYKASLKGELTKALEESPERAVDVCAKRAPELARAASGPGVTVGRSAIRRRSPANAPRPWLAPVMDELARAPSGSAASKVVALPNGGRGYAEAIWLAPQCVTCHGSTVAPPVASAIAARYPDDHATGFAPGDFRGVFWAELEPSALR